MKHLTYQQIQAIADGSMGAADRKVCEEHAAICRHCAREIAVQESLIRAIRHAPVVKTSRRFTRNVMERILPGSGASALLNFLGGAGKILAMGLVLAMIVFALTRTWSETPLIGSSAKNQSQFSSLLTQYYGQARQLFEQNSDKVGQTMVRQTTSQESRILAMIFLSLGGLALLDRYVFKPLLKMKL